jgi:hypothetical protein
MREKQLMWLLYVCQESVCSPTVRIIAFQAIDPGSTPGRRKRTFIFHKHKCNCHLKKKKKSWKNSIYILYVLFCFYSINMIGF